MNKFALVTSIVTHNNQLRTELQSGKVLERHVSNYVTDTDRAIIICYYWLIY